MNLKMRDIRKTMAVAIFSASFFISALPAVAASPALYWTTQKVKTSNFENCLSFAHKTMYDLKLSDIKKSKVDVSGRTANTHAAITCLSTSQGMTAVIMVAGEGNESKELRSKLSGKIGKLVQID
ncbi:MAG: hypothetical protein HY694_00880 [Deltaproteobacteria bacterium]|nr:hypothetical protein [Deltaproteobacteria bacterium]